MCDTPDEMPDFLAMLHNQQLKLSSHKLLSPRTLPSPPSESSSPDLYHAEDHLTHNGLEKSTVRRSDAVKGLLDGLNWVNGNILSHKANGDKTKSTKSNGQGTSTCKTIDHGTSRCDMNSIDINGTKAIGGEAYGHKAGRNGILNRLNHNEQINYDYGMNGANSDKYFKPIPNGKANGHSPVFPKRGLRKSVVEDGSWLKMYKEGTLSVNGDRGPLALPATPTFSSRYRSSSRKK